MGKRVILALLASVMACLTLCCISACANIGASDKGDTYIISFNTDGGSAVPDMVLKAGASIELPDDPVKAGYVFIGWFNDKDLKRPVNSAVYRANANATIFAGWESVETYPHAIATENSEQGIIKIISPADQRASMGTEVKVSVTPYDAYAVVAGSVKAIGATAEIALTDNEKGNYIFVMPAEPVTVTAEFTERSYDITISPFLNNGSIALSTESAKQGDLVPVRAIPDYGYRLTSLYYIAGNSVTREPITGNYFVMKGSSAIVGAEFEPIDYEIEYEIKVDVRGSGKLDVGSNSAPAGVYVEYTVCPDLGYRLLSLTSDIMLDDGGFIMPASDITLEAEFVETAATADLYSITFSAANGTVGAERTEYASGEKVELLFAPYENYEIGCVSVNGAYVEGGSFIMPSENTVVVVDFIKRGYAIEFSGAYTGFIGNISAQYAYEGDLIGFDVEPRSDYVIKSLTLIATANGVSSSQAIALNAKSFVMPAADVIIEVKMVAANYSFAIVAADADGGIISLPTSAKYGENVSVTIVPDEGYRLKKGTLVAKYLLSGSEVVENITASFIMPAAPVTVCAEFEKFYSVGYIDEENIAIFPSVTEMCVGDQVSFTVTVRGDYLLSSVYITVRTGAGYEGETENGVFTMTEDNAGDVSIDYDRSRYSGMNSIIERMITIVKVEGGSISVPKTYNVKYGSLIPITVKPLEGYRLNKILLESESATYRVSDVFVMPEYDIKLKAEFEKEDESNDSLENIYTGNRDSFYTAGIFLEYYREAYQIRAFFGGKSKSLIGYVGGIIAARSAYGHDFYVIKVKSLMKLNAIAQESVKCILNNYPRNTAYDVEIDYNYIIVSVGGSAIEDAAMLRNGIIYGEDTADCILYARNDDTFGLYAYTGSAAYVDVLPAYNYRSVSYIAPYAFKRAADFIEGITLGNVTEFDDFALAGLYKIKYAYVGYASYVGKGVFMGCDNLLKIGVSGGNTAYTTDKYGALYSTNKNRLVAYPAGNTSERYEVKTGCVEIGDYAFYGAAYLQRLSYPGSLVRIGDYAFCGADALEYVCYGTSSVINGVAEFNATNSKVASIGRRAFDGCIKLNKFRFDKITSIGEGAVSVVGDAEIHIYVNCDLVIKAMGVPVDMNEAGDGATLFVHAGALADSYADAKYWMALGGSFSTD